MKPYNILYIHTHDTGRHLNVYGYAAPGAHLKGFAEDALLFRNAFCVSPTCSPSRGALLTGRYPHANGMIGLTNRGFSLNNYGQHLVPYLNAHGYQTVLCGIQHEAGKYLEHAHGAKVIGYGQDITTDPLHGDMESWDRANASQAEDYISKAQNPFFLSVGFFSTHREYPLYSSFNPDYLTPPEGVFNNQEAREDHARYLESVNNFDSCFGKVVDALKKSGHYDNTIIIATTDHGLALPFRKCNLNDSGIGVYLILRCPEGRRGEIEENMVSHIDIFPTLCDLLEIEKPQHLQGQSFAPLMFQNGLAAYRDYVFAEVNFHTSYEPTRAVRSQRFKYIKSYDDYPQINCSNIDNSKVKDFLLQHQLAKRRKPQAALYDLYFDPMEKTNVIEYPSYGFVVEEMEQALVNWGKQTEDIVPIKNFLPQWKVNRSEALDPKSTNPADYL